MTTALPGSLPTVMIIDDDPTAVHMFETVAQQAGYAATAARDGQEALAQLNQTEPHVILLDLMLPGMSGFEVLRHIRTERKYKGCVIVVTNLGSDADIKKGLALGADDYLVKGNISMKDLRRKLTSCIPKGKVKSAAQ